MSGGRLRPSDYHKVLLKRLRALETGLRGEFGDFESRAYVDTGPVVERNVARAAGLGWTGKNTCLIHPKLGSWNFLAVLVTSLELPEEAGPLTGPLTIPDGVGAAGGAWRLAQPGVDCAVPDGCYEVHLVPDD